MLRQPRDDNRWVAVDERFSRPQYERYQMKRRVAIVGAGVSGLTCAVLFAESGFETSILAEQIGDETNSAAAAAIWYPYDVGSTTELIPWALISYGRFLELARFLESGVSLIELRVFSRQGPLAPPDWARLFAPGPSQREKSHLPSRTASRSTFR